MNASDKAFDLIKQCEGCRLSSYQDSVGVWTIGYGHTRNAHPGQTITQDEADTLLRNDVAVTEGIVRIAITFTGLTQHQFDACVVFAFNVGSGNFTKSTLLAKLNAGDVEGAAAEFSKWNHAGGKVLEGLTKRRRAEQALFLAQ